MWVHLTGQLPKFINILKKLFLFFPEITPMTPGKQGTYEEISILYAYKYTQ